MNPAEKIEKLANDIISDWDMKYKRVKDCHVVCYDICTKSVEVRSQLINVMSKFPNGAKIEHCSISFPHIIGAPELDGLSRDDLNHIEDMISSAGWWVVMSGPDYDASLPAFIVSDLPKEEK